MHMCSRTRAEAFIYLHSSPLQGSLEIESPQHPTSPQDSLTAQAGLYTILVYPVSPKLPASSVAQHSSDHASAPYPGQH